MVFRSYFCVKHCKLKRYLINTHYYRISKCIAIWLGLFVENQFAMHIKLSLLPLFIKYCVIFNI